MTEEKTNMEPICASCKTLAEKYHEVGRLLEQAQKDQEETQQKLTCLRAEIQGYLNALEIVSRR